MRVLRLPREFICEPVHLSRDQREVPQKGWGVLWWPQKGFGVLCPQPRQQVPWKIKAGNSISLCLGEVFICVGSEGRRLPLALGSPQWKLEGRVAAKRPKLLGSHSNQHE